MYTQRPSEQCDDQPASTATLPAPDRQPSVIMRLSIRRLMSHVTADCQRVCQGNILRSCMRAGAKLGESQPILCICGTNGCVWTQRVALGGFGGGTAGMGSVRQPFFRRNGQNSKRGEKAKSCRPSSHAASPHLVPPTLALCDPPSLGCDGYLTSSSSAVVAWIGRFSNFNTKEPANVPLVLYV